MKTLPLLLLVCSTVFGGEIADRFHEEAKARRDAAFKLIQAETNILKRMELLSQSSPVTGRTTTNNGTVYVGAALRFVQKNPVADHDIVEIGLERTGCYGTCPAYTFVITADAKCNYDGGKYAKIQGKKTGRTRVDIFNRLATLVKEMGVFELQDEYTVAIYDVPSAYFTAATKEKRKTIRDHAGLAPVQLWAVEQLMDKILEEVRWEDTSP